MMRFQDTIRPLLLAPLGSVVSLMVFSVLFGKWMEMLMGFWIYVALIYVFSLAAGLMFVVPVLALVPSLRQPSLWVALPWGVIVAWAAAWLNGPINTALQNLLRWEVLIPYGAAGAASGLVYTIAAQRTYHTASETESL